MEKEIAPVKQYRHSFLTTSCLTAVMMAALGSAAQANPLDGTVVGGAATITETGKKLDVVQTTDRAVIDWRSFNIAPDEHTQFYQPNSSSIAVNRVTSVDPSTIAGKLSANGNVVLINPNGVFFSKTATVDVNGLVAITADIDNSKFMAGGPLAFTKTGNAHAAIINEGSITAKDAGLVGLVAPNVINSGTITAKLGRVQLASGDSVTVDLYGDGLMEVKASDALTAQVVENSGRINAAGGTIALTAAAGRATVNSVVKVSGELLAPSVAEKNGKIIIAAEGSNKTAKSGTSSVLVQHAVLDASGRNAGEHGGTISVTADHVTVGGQSVLTASGYSGGGSVLLGGDYQGNGNLANAQYLTLEQGTTVWADALASGNGGRIILWSDAHTLFAGALSARGGSTGGAGGFVETSGKHYLTVTGTVDLTAADGSAGIWLLDPTDITIYNRSGSGDLTNTFTAAQLESMSTSANVSLSATNNITLDLAGDTVNFATAGRSLTLTAGNQINSASTGTITTNNGAISLTGTNGVVFNHALTFNSGSAATGITATNAPVTFNATMNFGGDTTVNAGTGTITTSAINSGSHNLSLISDDLTIGGDLTGTGNLLLRPLGNRNIRLDWYSGDYDIDGSEIAHLKDGWNLITIGHSGVGSFSIGDTAWSDNLSLVQTTSGFGTIYFNGTQTFTGGASGTYTGAYIDITKNITTDGGSFTFNGVVTSYGNAIIASHGGAVNFNGSVRVSASGTPLNVNSSGGDITFGDTVFDINGSNAGKTVLLNAGTGTISFANTVNGDFNLTANAGTITLNGAWGGSTALGNVSLNAGTGTITTGAIAVGTHDLTLTSDSVVLNGDLSGTGTLTLQPYSTTREVRLNNGPQEYSLLTAELDHLKDGWGNINIGRDDSTATLYVNYGTWSDPVTFLGNHAKTIYVNLVGTSFTFFNGWTDLYGNITTNGGDVVVATNRTDSSQSYIDAGTFYSFGNTINTNNGDVRFMRYVPAAGVSTIDSGNGSILFQGVINRSYSTSNIGMVLRAGGGDITFGGAVDGTFGGGLLSLTASAANFSFNGAWGDTTPLGSVSLTSLDSDIAMPTLTTTGNVTLDAGYGVITTGAISTGTGNLSLISRDLVINGDLTGSGTLALRPNATAATMRVNYYSGDYNIDTAELAHLKDGWSMIEFGRADSANTLNFGGGSFTDPVTFHSYNTGIFGNFVGTGNASLTSNDGMIFFNDSSVTTQGGAFTLNNTLVFDNSGGTINTHGGGITLGGAISKTGTAGNVVLDAGGGTLDFGSTVNGNFNLTAVANSIGFNGAWGGSAPLGDVSLTSVSTLTLPSISAASIFARTTGAVADLVLANTSRLAASASGNAITLASARNFLNNSGTATPFTLSGGGRWLTYSANPANDTLNGLGSTFTRTGCTYVGGCSGGTTIPASGNGFIYSYTPVVVPPTPDPDPTPAPTPPAAANDLPPQVLRAINTDPYMPRYVLIELPANTRTPDGEQPRKQRVETAASSNSFDYDSDLSLTLSPALKKRLEKYTDI